MVPSAMGENSALVFAQDSPRSTTPVRSPPIWSVKSVEKPSASSLMNVKLDGSHISRHRS